MHELPSTQSDAFERMTYAERIVTTLRKGLHRTLDILPLLLLQLQHAQ